MRRSKRRSWRCVRQCEVVLQHLSMERAVPNRTVDSPKGWPGGREIERFSYRLNKEIKPLDEARSVERRRWAMQRQSCVETEEGRE